MSPSVWKAAFKYIILITIWIRFWMKPSVSKTIMSSSYNVKHHALTRGQRLPSQWPQFNTVSTFVNVTPVDIFEAPPLAGVSSCPTVHVHPQTENRAVVNSCTSLPITTRLSLWQDWHLWHGLTILLMLVWIRDRKGENITYSHISVPFELCVCHLGNVSINLYWGHLWLSKCWLLFSFFQGYLANSWSCLGFVPFSSVLFSSNPWENEPAFSAAILSV